MVSKVPDKEVFGDLDAFISRAEKNGRNPDTVAIAGFCWGGQIVWLYSGHNPNIKGGLAWYGRLVNDGAPSEMNPTFPLDIAEKLKTPVLGLYGGKDTGISLESVKKCKRHWQKVRANRR